jgi:hypothetical protein
MFNHFNRAILFIFIQAMAFVPVLAQNLVMNWSFEDYVNCPEGRMDSLVGWYLVRYSPDCFNGCDPPIAFNAPLNILGFQEAFHGGDYSGELCFGSFDTDVFYDNNELMAGTLVSNLVPGMSYDISFKACLADESPIASNNLGLRFWTHIPYELDYPTLLDNFAHIYSTEFISDSINWTTISGSFIADSSYTHLTIGNHFNNANTDTLNLSPGWNGAYYYFDAVSVVPTPDFVFVDFSSQLCMGESASFYAYGPFTGWALAGDPENIFSTDPQLNFIVSGAETYLAFYPDTTFEVSFLVNESPSIDLGSDFAICEGQSYDLDLSGGPPNITWQDGSTDFLYSITEPGMYYASAAANGCTTTDTLVVNDFPENGVSFPENYILCHPDTLSLEIVSNGSSIQWQDGSNNNNFSVTEPGEYWASVVYGECISTDTINVTVDYYPDVDLGIDTMICDGQSFEISLGNDIELIQWHDGYSEQERLISTPGIYWVTASNSSCFVTDTLVVNDFPENVVSFPDEIVLCENEIVILEVPTNILTATWQDGTTTNIYQATISGQYWATINYNECISSDTVNITFENFDEIDLGNDTTLCYGDSWIVDAERIGNQNYSYLWGNGSELSFFEVSSSTYLWVVATNGICTVYSDTIYVSTFKDNLVYLPEDEILCAGETLSLSIPQSNLIVTWQDGSTGNYYEIITSGVYYATAQVEECVFSDTISVFFQPYAEVYLGNDTTICEGETLLLDAGNPGYTYLWQDNSEGQMFEVSSAGIFSVEVSLNDCSSEDEIQIDVYPNQTFSLGNDTLLCEQTNTSLSIDGDWESILWSTGANTNEITVESAGLYWATVIDFCTTQNDTIKLSPGYCNCQLYLPYVLNTNTLGIEQTNTTEFNCPLADFGMKIYDPIGRIISETTDINWQWDPHTNIAFGVYVFAIRYRFEHESEMRYLTQKILVAERIRN